MESKGGEKKTLLSESTFFKKEPTPIKMESTKGAGNLRFEIENSKWVHTYSSILGIQKPLKWFRKQVKGDCFNLIEKLE